MVSTSEFYVAIELGSTRISGVAGRRTKDGGLSIMAYASEDASACIRKGMIFNVDKTAGAITAIINRLEASLDAGISKVYVGIGGWSLRTVRGSVSRSFGEEVRITSDIVEGLITTDKNTEMGELEILEVIPQEYKVGTTLQADPIGVVADQIEGHFLNIVARTGVRRQIESCFELARTRIAGYFIAPLELAKVVLSDAELRSGCALVDFGAETTTVQVYKDHILRHLVVLPLGGASITKDICSCRIEEADAEELKIKYASACADRQESQTGDETVYRFGSEDGTISDRLLCEIVEGRQEEIIANVWNQIRLSGYDDRLMAGIVITGGASNMQDLQKAITRKTGVEKVKQVPYVSLPVESVTPELLSKNSRVNTLLGLLASCRENCREQEPVKESLFDEQGESLAAQAERERQEREELEQKQKEEAARQARAEEEARAAEAARLAKEKADREAALRAEEAARQAEEERKRRDEERRRKKEQSLIGRLQRWGKKLADDIVNGED